MTTIFTQQRFIMNPKLTLGIWHQLREHSCTALGTNLVLRKISLTISTIIKLHVRLVLPNRKECSSNYVWKKYLSNSLLVEDRKLLKRWENANLQSLSLESLINLDLVYIVTIYQLYWDGVSVKKLLTDLAFQKDEDRKLIIQLSYE